MWVSPAWPRRQHRTRSSRRGVELTASDAWIEVTGVSRSPDTDGAFFWRRSRLALQSRTTKAATF